MAVRKTELFNNSQIKIAELAKAISHPARIAILQKLSRHTNCICNDLAEELPLAQSTVSQHLKALKNAGIIHGEIDGPRTCYCLNRDKLSEMYNSLSSLFNSLNDTENQSC